MKDCFFWEGDVDVDMVEVNRKAWNKKVAEGSRYTQAVNSETINKSKSGEWEITVTTE